MSFPSNFCQFISILADNFHPDTLPAFPGAFRMSP